MRRKTVVLTLAVFLLSAALLAAGLATLWRDWNGQQRPNTPPPRQVVKPTWQTATAFSGSLPGQTQSFSVERGPWRLRWRAGGSPNSSSLGFTVFSTNGALPPVAEKNGLRPPDTGVMEFSRGGDFYILVSSFDADWTFTIEKQSFEEAAPPPSESS